MKKNIFITGIHRSGSSWVGRMLAAAEKMIVEDEEIFNCASEISDTPMTHMYTYVCRENAPLYEDFVARMVRNRYAFWGSLRRARSARDVARVCKRKLRSLGRRLPPARRTLFIEPIGLLSAEWFSERFGTPVVVVIRHPASFVSSLKKLNWGFNFRDFLDQDLLMERFFSDFRKEMQNAPQKPDVVGMGILQWKLMYSVVDRYRRDHPDWIFRRHEDLASDPIPEFRKLYERLGLPFTEKSEEVIRRHTSKDNPAEFTGKRDRSRRDSLQTVTIWKKRLSPEEIRRIREGVESVSCRFYDEGSWT